MTILAIPAGRTRRTIMQVKGDTEYTNHTVSRGRAAQTCQDTIAHGDWFVEGMSDNTATHN